MGTTLSQDVSNRARVRVAMHVMNSADIDIANAYVLVLHRYLIKKKK